MDDKGLRQMGGPPAQTARPESVKSNLGHLALVGRCFPHYNSRGHRIMTGGSHPLANPGWIPQQGDYGRYCLLRVEKAAWRRPLHNIFIGLGKKICETRLQDLPPFLTRSCDEICPQGCLLKAHVPEIIWRGRLSMSGTLHHRLPRFGDEQHPDHQQSSP